MGNRIKITFLELLHVPGTVVGHGMQDKDPALLELGDKWRRKAEIK